MKTTVYIGSERWYLIHDFDQFLKTWKKAYRKNRFFRVSYAGRRMLVNPRQIIMIEGRSSNAH